MIELLIAFGVALFLLLLGIIGYFLKRIIDRVDETGDTVIDIRLEQTNTSNQIFNLKTSAINLEEKISKIDENVKKNHNEFLSHIKDLHNEKS